MKIIIDYDKCLGKPVIAIGREIDGKQEVHPFTFGLNRAALLLDALKQEPDFLERFIEAHRCTA